MESKAYWPSPLALESAYQLGVHLYPQGTLVQVQEERMGEDSHCPVSPSDTLLLFFHLQIRVQSDPGTRGPQIRVGRVTEVLRYSSVLQVGHPHLHHSPELSTQGSLPPRCAV